MAWRAWHWQAYAGIADVHAKQSATEGQEGQLKNNMVHLLLHVTFGYASSLTEAVHGQRAAVAARTQPGCALETHAVPLQALKPSTPHIMWWVGSLHTRIC